MWTINIVSVRHRHRIAGVANSAWNRGNIGREKVDVEQVRQPERIGIVSLFSNRDASTATSNLATDEESASSTLEQGTRLVTHFLWFPRNGTAKIVRKKSSPQWPPAFSTRRWQFHWLYVEWNYSLRMELPHSIRLRISPAEYILPSSESLPQERKRAFLC